MVQRIFDVNWGQSGVEMFYRIIDYDTNIIIARTNAGIIEFPSGSGIYRVVVPWDNAWGGQIIWDDGSSNPNDFASESFNPITVEEISGLGPIKLTINVSDDESQALSNVSVRVQSGPFTYNSQTDQSGVVIFGLMANTYSLIVVKVGYISVVTNITIAADQTIDLVLSEAAPATPNDGWFNTTGAILVASDTGWFNSTGTTSAAPIGSTTDWFR